MQDALLMIEYQGDHEYRRKEYFILPARRFQHVILPSSKPTYRSLPRGGCPAKSPLQKYGAYDLQNTGPPIPWLETAPLGPTKPVKVEASRCIIVYHSSSYTTIQKKVFVGSNSRVETWVASLSPTASALQTR